MNGHLSLPAGFGIMPFRMDRGAWRNESTLNTYINTLIMSQRTRIVFSIVVSLGFCLLVGCGGGGSAASNVSGIPVVTPQNPSPMQPAGTDEPDNMVPPPDPTPDPIDPMTLLPTGLLNEVKFSLVKAQQAWQSDTKLGGYTGEGVVIGVMEEVNPFHVLFGSGDESKIHSDSILTSLYPKDLPPPPSKYIVDNEDGLIVNDKSQMGANRMKKYPPVPCLLQFDGIDDCPDTSGSTKYFLRVGSDIHVLPGLTDPNSDRKSVV